MASKDSRGRERRPPAYLSDYAMDTDLEVEQSSHAMSTAGSSASPSHHSIKSDSRKSQSSRHSVISSLSRSSKHSVRSVLSQLSDRQSAKLEAVKKRAELEELRRRRSEDQEADKVIGQLEDEAFEAQTMAEEQIVQARVRAQMIERKAIKKRERMQSELSRLRDIRDLERQLAEAEMVETMLDENVLPTMMPKVNLRVITANPDTNVDTNPDTSIPDPNLVTTKPDNSVIVPREPDPVNSSSVTNIVTANVTPNQTGVATVTDNTPLEVEPKLIPIPTTSGQPVAHSIPSVVPSHSLVTPTDATPHVAKMIPVPTPTRQPDVHGTLNVVPSQPLATPTDATPHDAGMIPLSTTSGQPLIPSTCSMPNMAELLIASSYGVPKPTLPYFSTGREKDFAVLKIALDSLVSSHAHLSEQYKYQVLMGQLGGSPKRLAEAYLHDPNPYTSAMQALKDSYGLPRQLVQSELSNIMNMSAIKFGDCEMFENFSLAVHTLVGMLKSLEGENGYELRCGSHVDRLLGKLPPSTRDSFVEYCLNKGILTLDKDQTYTLNDFSDWLKVKARAKKIASRAASVYQPPKPTRDASTVHHRNHLPPPTAVFSSQTKSVNSTSTHYDRDRSKPLNTSGYCAYCNNRYHHVSTCPDFKKLPTVSIVQWIKEKSRCWNCGRAHKTDECNLKKVCLKCKKLHLTAMHDAIELERPPAQSAMSTSVKHYFIDQPSRPSGIILKIVPVVLHGPSGDLNTYAILDDGSMRTMILTSAVNQLNLEKRPNRILLSTIRSGSFECHGHAVDLTISPANDPQQRFEIHNAFTSDQISLSEYSYHTEELQKQHPHLRDASLPRIENAMPTILIGSDHANMILPVKPINFGPDGTPVAVCTKFGWSLQGPTKSLMNENDTSCYFMQQLSSGDQLHQSVERLWQMDILPYSGRQVTRSKEDMQALSTLEAKTMRVEVDGEKHYATPLLRRNCNTKLYAEKEAVMANLKRTEKHHMSRPELADIHNREIQKLVDSGYVRTITDEEASQSTESWYFPHHIVQHNDKSRLVFNCSFEYRGRNLNKQLLPGPILGSSLLGVLLRFRQNKIAVSGDIKAMFHQVRLLPEDQPLLRFLWRNMDLSAEPRIYQWEVLPFGTTCSPCCATFTLLKHALSEQQQYPEVARCVSEAFYVDNCLDSLNDAVAAKELVTSLRKVLADGGFNIRQWASNVPEVIEHLPPEAKSDSHELWSTLGQTDQNEAALGLHWKCDRDVLTYRYRPILYNTLTMKTVYQVLATQYDPIGYLTPYTSRAKVLVQDMWTSNSSKQTWDEEISHTELRERWTKWESELGHISSVCLPRCYIPADFDVTNVRQQLHIFCDASERVYGSVGYLRTVNVDNQVHVSFVAARSRVAPKKQISMPRLELCAALTGAQLADTLCKELDIPIPETTFWSDSTTVLTWLQSDSCRYKVYVGTRVTEIQSLTSVENWNYVNTKDNPADDITRGKTLKELCEESRWRSGPYFLVKPADQWPHIDSKPVLTPSPDTESELKRIVVHHVHSPQVTDMPQASEHTTFTSLTEATKQYLDGAAINETSNTCTTEAAENTLFRSVQQECFPEELEALKTGKGVLSTSRLLELAPEYDADTGLIRVGGRLRLAEDIPSNVKHPIVLDPKHPVTKLLIQHYDHKLHHYGPERLLAELRRNVWILRGREAVRRHQRECTDCQKLRGTPKIPRMADLPQARLRLYKPAFYSTGVDCFGPMWVTIGRRREKRWGIIFKCLTTRAVHLDLLHSMDADTFLMSVRRFISLRGKPFELLSDCGTNFKGGEAELKEAFSSMGPNVAQQLSSQKILFKFNPPYAPHFGGAWEREVRSVKQGLRAILGDQSVSEPVLQTVLAEIAAILNSKPLGYVSSDISDIDPVTPNSLLMGRPDTSLPQVVYPEDELLGRRRWRQCQVLADQFWRTFIRRYLPTLHPRGKWCRDRDPLDVGDIVMIIDPNQIRAKWLTGRIEETFRSSDGRIRTARVHSGEHDYVRSVSRLVKLPELND